MIQKFIDLLIRELHGQAHSIRSHSSLLQRKSFASKATGKRRTECYYLECVTSAGRVKEIETCLPPAGFVSFLLPCSRILGSFSLLHRCRESQWVHAYALSSALNTRLVPVHPEPDDVFRDSKKKFLYLRSWPGRWKIPPGSPRIYKVFRNYQT